MPPTNIDTLVNMNKVYPFDLSFKKFTNFLPIIEVNRLKVGGALGNKCFLYVGHHYWHPIIATSFPQDNSSEFSPIMPEEFGEHLIRDQRPFLHPESLQILQIHSSMCFSLVHPTHGWISAQCSVTHSGVDFDVCIGLLF